MRYKLWHSASEGCHIFFPSNQHPGDLPEDARLVWTVEASSWEAAQTAKHDFLGWDPYLPMPESESADTTEDFPHEVHFKFPNQMLMKGITVGQVTGKERVEEIVLDVAQKPAHMDMTRLVRGEKQTVLAIYKIEGDVLTIGFSRGGDRKPPTERPTAFESDTRTKADLLVLKRKAKASR